MDFDKGLGSPASADTDTDTDWIQPQLRALRHNNEWQVLAIRDAQGIGHWRQSAEAHSFLLWRLRLLPQVGESDALAPVCRAKDRSYLVAAINGEPQGAQQALPTLR